jgi:hypothetical protein
MSRGLLNMSCYVQGPFEHVLPQLQQDVRQFPCGGLLAFLCSDRSHAEPQRNDSQVVIEKIKNHSLVNAVGYFYIFFLGGGEWVLQCVGHSFDYVAHFAFLRDVWIRTQRLRELL